MNDQPQYPSYPGSDEPHGQQPGQQPPPPPPGYGQAPQGPPAYGQAPQGPPAYGQPAYGQAPQGPPVYGAPAYGYGYPPQPRTSGKAMGAMIVGIASIVVCYVGVLIGPVAIVLAVLGKKDIKKSNGAQTGEGMATAGLITGIIGTVVWLALDVLGILAVVYDW